MFECDIPNQVVYSLGTWTTSVAGDTLATSFAAAIEFQRRCEIFGDTSMRTALRPGFRFDVPALSEAHRQ